MRDMRLRTRVRLHAASVGAALSLVFLGRGPGLAASPTECRDLAARFAEAPADLDLQSLAGLLTCVSAEIQDRAGGPPSPTPSPPEEAPAPTQTPAPPQASPPPRARDQWPPPVPWGGDWPPASPWER